MPAISANPEVDRGLKGLYAQLRDATKQNDGALPVGFSKSFTSADGTVTLTLSAEGLGAYAGSLNDDGTAVRQSDAGIHLKEIVRSGEATAESNALSNAIHSVEDLNAHQRSIEQSFWITDMGVVPSEDDGTDVQPVTGADLAQGLADFSASDPTLQSKQRGLRALIATLMSFLQSLKHGASDTNAASSPTPGDKSVAADAARTPSVSSLLIRVDAEA